MTNQEAIWIINNRLNTYYCTDDDLKALDLAIKALEIIDIPHTKDHAIFKGQKIYLTQGHIDALNENDSCNDFKLKETNNFRTVCQCCNRIIKGNESKYAIQLQKYPLKEEFGYYVQGKKYSLCKKCLRSIELFIKKGANNHEDKM